MTAHCAACNAVVADDPDTIRYRLEDAFSYLCMSCWGKVARGGREPREVLEAILIFNNDPDVGGPDDPLDHEDYRDLERLGLLSDSPG
jgi:hypothetical protein